MADTIKNISVQGDIIPVEDSYARERIITLESEIEEIDIPTKTSELTNDSGFITSIPNIPTNTSQLTNDSGFITTSAIPKGLSYFNNDVGFITSSQVPSQDLSDYYKKEETYSAAEIDEKISEGGGGSVDLSKYYKKTETYSQAEVDQKFTDLTDSLDTEATDAEVQEVLGKEE